MKQITTRAIALMLALLTVLVLLPMPAADAAALKRGSKGTEVRRLQQNLIGLGYLEGEADGSFGRKTQSAVQRFQADFGLGIDGNAGEKTQTALRNAVVRVQIELQQAGCKPGSADGSFGAKTRAAVKRYQEDMDLKETGIADRATRKSLDANTSGLKVTKKLTYGSDEKQVKYLQQALIGLGYLNGDADGIYGSKTREGVRKFQKAYGLSTDGSAGPATLRALKNAVVTLQSDLARKGYGSGTINGVYGKGTKSAVKAYQRDRGIAVTGVAGPDTMRKLYGIAFGADGTINVIKLDVVPQYQNGDYRKIIYGKYMDHTTTVSKSGCGGVSLAMVLNSLLDTDKYDGLNVMQWFARKGYYYGSGTEQEGLWDYPQRLGLHAGDFGSEDTLVKHLQKGRFVIALISDRCGNAYFCKPESNGHFIVVCGYREKDGVPQVYVQNPLSYKRSGWFDLESLMDNVKTAADGYPRPFVVIYD